MIRAPSIVWFRLDLRLADNPALQAAVKLGGPIIPLYIDTSTEAPWREGGASRWWLGRSLESLAASLGKKRAGLVLRRGDPSSVLQELIGETGAQAVFWNRRYEPSFVARDQKIKESLKSVGVEVESFNSALLFEPGEIKNKSGECFKVFTPFWRACLAATEPSLPLPEPKTIAAWPGSPSSLSLTELGLKPIPDWASGLEEAWKPGEAQAQEELSSFLRERLQGYLEHRNFPGHAGTSGLSPYLHFGEIGPRQIWHATKRHELRTAVAGTIRQADGYLRELGWREFAHHLLFHFPRTPTEPLRREFGKFPWHEDTKSLQAWQKGRTGYPIVDAGMRELWTTGWMHNRARMIAASFLVKDLLLPWQEGAKWFWDTLVDADLANNTLGWQWSAGCGADAAPYFRIFNPVLQGEKFDPQGAYIARWIPELKGLPQEWIHRPWMAPEEVLARAKVSLGKSYPYPRVDHGEARNLALAAFKRISSRAISKA